MLSLAAYASSAVVGGDREGRRNDSARPITELQVGARLETSLERVASGAAGTSPRAARFLCACSVRRKIGVWQTDRQTDIRVPYGNPRHLTFFPSFDLPAAANSRPWRCQAASGGA